ncbi:DnaJ domain-containing protein [Sporodiniella umbellata]|nr:DnaJ domain-containing protein [Sporodiniella umbellata]
MTDLPDYYDILGVSPSASQAEIREAYKKEALLYHPDRLDSHTSATEKEEATRRFQVVADAYFTLNDQSRRSAYDKTRSHQERFTPFSFATPHASTAQANHIFGDVFEELLKSEVAHPTYLWRILGAGAGAILGFIFGNVPGAAIGAFAGKTLGQVRDHKGMYIYIYIQICHSKDDLNGVHP